MGEVVPGHTSPTLHPPSPPTALIILFKSVPIASIVVTSTLRVNIHSGRFKSGWQVESVRDLCLAVFQFTVARFNRLVEPNREATFYYQFTPSETFNARPFGLTINLNYKDVVSMLFYVNPKWGDPGEFVELFRYQIFETG